MLPDYVDTKRRLQDVFTRWVRRRVREHLGPLGEIPRSTIFEGRGTSITRPDKREDVAKMVRIESAFSVQFDEVPNLTLADILARLDRTAQEMADEMAKHTYSTISETANRVGNVVRSTGQLTPAAILEMFERIEIAFDERGEAEMPSIHIHPNAAETLRESVVRLEQDPEHRRRFHEIMTEKKRRWRAREAHRRLVG